MRRDPKKTLVEDSKQPRTLSDVFMVVHLHPPPSVSSGKWCGRFWQFNAHQRGTVWLGRPMFHSWWM